MTDTVDNWVDSPGESATVGSAENLTESTAGATSDTVRPQGWTDESHGNATEPNYAVVYPKDQVNELTITIAPDDWAAMQADMTELLGERGQGGDLGGGGLGGNGGPPNGGGGAATAT